jgi:hypothetical protein
MSSIKKPYVSKKAKTKSVDVIIVGGGIAGLYSAFLLRKYHPHLSYLILEGTDRIGGRIKLSHFHGYDYPIGAGIGRQNDILLKQLLETLKIPCNEFLHTHSYSFQHSFTREKLIQLIDHFKRSGPPIPKQDTVYEFLEKTLDPNVLKEFILISGYEDFLNDPASEYFETQNVEELFFDFPIFSVEWKTMLKRIVDYVNKKNILLEHNVVSIDYIELDDIENSTYFLVKSKQRNLKKLHFFSASQIILATTIDSVKTLVPSNLLPIYRQIHGQPFLKVLGLFKHSYWKLAQEKIPSMMITNNILRKIFPMNSKTGIYMIAYNDNDSATELIEATSLLPKRNKLRFYEKLLQEVLGIHLALEDINENFWSLGTHYYDPLNTGSSSRKQFIHRAQRPMKNMFVVGEMVSEKQGWVEGALESVQTILKEI